MRAIRPVVLAAALAVPVLALATPAHAGTHEDAACLADRLSAADWAAIIAETRAGGSGESVSRLAGPLDACSDGQNWTPERRGNAAGFAVAIVVRATSHELLAAAGVDTAALDRWFARQSLEFRTTAFSTMSEADLAAAFATLAGHELPADAVDRHMEEIGAYIGALVVMERLDRGLEL